MFGAEEKKKTFLCLLCGEYQVWCVEYLIPFEVGFICTDEKTEVQEFKEFVQSKKKLENGKATM